MLVMTESRKPGRPAKHGPTNDAGRSGRRISLDIDPEIRATMDRFAEDYFRDNRLRIGMTQIIEKALIELFERSKHWPPPTKPGKRPPAPG